jgi:hypothetical protein
MNQNSLAGYGRRDTGTGDGGWGWLRRDPAFAEGLSCVMLRRTSWVGRVCSSGDVLSAREMLRRNGDGESAIRIGGLGSVPLGMVRIRGSRMLFSIRIADITQVFRKD